MRSAGGGGASRGSVSMSSRPTRGSSRDHPARLLGIVDQLDLDVEQLEQRLGIVGAGLGQVRSDLRPQPLEQRPVGARQPIEPDQLELGAGPARLDAGLGHRGDHRLELADPRPVVAGGDRRGRRRREHQAGLPAADARPFSGAAAAPLRLARRVAGAAVLPLAVELLGWSTVERERCTRAAASRAAVRRR